MWGTFKAYLLTPTKGNAGVQGYEAAAAMTLRLKGQPAAFSCCKKKLVRLRMNRGPFGVAGSADNDGDNKVVPINYGASSSASALCQKDGVCTERDDLTFLPLRE